MWWLMGCMPVGVGQVRELLEGRTDILADAERHKIQVHAMATSSKIHACSWW